MSSASSGTLNSVYMVATLGDELSSNSTLSSALAYASLAKSSYIEFTLGQETEVSLGILYNLSTYARCNFSKFSLFRQELEIAEADGETSIYDAISDGKAETVTPREGGVMIASKEKEVFRIFTADGKCVFNEAVHGVHSAARRCLCVRRQEIHSEIDPSLTHRIPCHRAYNNNPPVILETGGLFLSCIIRMSRPRYPIYASTLRRMRSATLAVSSRLNVSPVICS